MAVITRVTESVAELERLGSMAFNTKHWKYSKRRISMNSKQIIFRLINFKKHTHLDGRIVHYINVMRFWF